MGCKAGGDIKQGRQHAAQGREWDREPGGRGTEGGGKSVRAMHDRALIVYLRMCASVPVHVHVFVDFRERKGQERSVGHQVCAPALIKMCLLWVMAAGVLLVSDGPSPICLSP